MMKTMPSCEINKPPVRSFPLHTSTSKGSNNKATDTCTEAISYTKIKKPERNCGGLSPDGPLQNLDCTLDFAFEKNRIKAIENTELFVTISTTAVGPDTQAVALKQAEKNLEKAAEQYKHIDLIIYWMRNFAIVCTLFCAIGIIVTFFGVMFLSLNSVPVQEFLLWLSLEALASLIFMYVSVKVTGINRVTLGNNQRTFKLCLIFIIMLIAVMVIMNQEQSIGDAIEGAKGSGSNAGTKKERLLCVVLVCFFFTSLAKAVITMGYVTTWIILQLMINRLNSIQTGLKPKCGCTRVQKGKL